MPTKEQLRLTAVQRKTLSSDSRRGAINGLVIMSVAVLLLFVVGMGYLILKPSKSTLDEPLTAIVEEGVFIAEVLDQGEVQSSDNVEFRCEVKSRYSTRGISVLEVVDEGTLVNEGDVLIKLDAAELEASLETQVITVTKSEDVVKAAINRVKAAEEAKTEYLKGTFVAQKGLIENQILLAEEEKRKAEYYYRYSQRLAAKRYITDDQLQADKFAVLRAENALSLANTELAVLEEVSKKRMLIEFDTEIDSAQSNLSAAEESLKIEQRQLDELKEQIAACTISVPEGVSGQVTYANVFSSRGNSEWVLEPGATVREKQVMIRLPNRDMMQVKASVNEARITSIKEGMPAEIQVDALGDRTLEGVVMKVNQYPEPSGWGGGGVKKYGVVIEVVDPPMEIRPGMNAAVKIQITRRENAIIAPIQTIYGVGQRTFCLVKSGNKWETREIEIEMSNDQQVMIKSGVKKGDVLALNPAGYRDMMDIPADAIREMEAAMKSEEEVLDPEDEGAGGATESKRPGSGGGPSAGDWKGKKGGGNYEGKKGGGDWKGKSGDGKQLPSGGDATEKQGTSRQGESDAESKRSG